MEVPLKMFSALLSVVLITKGKVVVIFDFNFLYLESKINQQVACKDVKMTDDF